MEEKLINSCPVRGLCSRIIPDNEYCTNHKDCHSYFHLDKHEVAILNELTDYKNLRNQ